MAPAADDVALCGDDELDYLANQTQFELGQGFLLDEAYRLAHLPLVHLTIHASSRVVRAGPMRWGGTNPSFLWSCRLPTRCCSARRPILPSRPTSRHRRLHPR